MREIVVISGKGGTGKTSVVSALAYVAQKNLVLADCDVDAADLHLIFEPDLAETEDFFSGVKAVIDPASCTNCGICASHCRFDAIRVESGQHKVMSLDCEGCGYCYELCPTQAISLPQQLVGQCYRSRTRMGFSLVHAKLGIGADNSGKLVARVKDLARKQAKTEKQDFILIDGSPGIGCPVIASLSGADQVLFVTEPSLSALSDLKRVWELTDKFQIPAQCVINKADINPAVTEEIKLFLASQGIALAAEIPYDGDFHTAIAEGKSLIEINQSKWSPVFENIWTACSQEKS
ncbi:MAG TPA: ATP-binding protein [Candidatus Cloacimonadota bacterium]|nr:ATP-binding protein [Candidatus Cloacimonadota bacterium]